MIPTTITVSPTTGAQVQRILGDAERYMDRLLAGPLPFDAQMTCCKHRFLEAARDLDRLAAHPDRTVYLRPVAR